MTGHQSFDIDRAEADVMNVFARAAAVRTCVAKEHGRFPCTCEQWVHYPSPAAIKKCNEEWP